MPRVTQPAPSYQPYQPRPPMMGVAAPPKQSGGGLTSMLAAILAFVTAGLAIGGTFAPITTLRITNEGGGQTTVYGEHDGWWNFGDDGSTDPLLSESKLLGLVLVLSATLLVLGAVFALVASRSRTQGPTTGGRSLIAAGVGVLTGVTLAQALDVLRLADRYNSRELEAGEAIDFAPGLGLVLPLCAVGLGLVAVVLAHVGQRARGARQEPLTPKMGFPAPYGYQRQGAPGTPPAGSTPGTPKPADTSDDDSETTQVVSNATASGQDSATPSGQGAVAAALSGQTPPATAPPALVTPPAPVRPPDPASPAAPQGQAPAQQGQAPAAPTPPAGSGAPVTPPQGGFSAPSGSPAQPPAGTPASAAPQAPAAPAAPSTPAAPATPAPSAPPAPASAPGTSGAPAASTASGAAPAPAAPAAAPAAPAAPGASAAPAAPSPPASPAAPAASRPSAPSPGASGASATPATPATPSVPAASEAPAAPAASTPPASSEPPAAPEAPTDPAAENAPQSQPAREAGSFSGLPSAPPPPELSDDAKGDK